MDGLLRDARYAWRRLLATPGTSLLAILSLGLGIGANTALFNLVDALFLKPLPLARPGELAALYTTDPVFRGFAPSSYLNFLDYQNDRSVFSGLAAALAVEVTLGGHAADAADTAEPERVPGAIVSAGYFGVLGVRPQLGRFFLPDEARERGGGPSVVVLSDGCWRRRFHADPAIVGRALLLNGRPFAVLGVAASGFAGHRLLLAPELWVPMSTRREIVAGPLLDWFGFRDALMLDLVGRLRPGIGLAQAQARVRTLARRLEQAYPKENHGRGAALLPLSAAALDPNTRARDVRLAAFLLVMVGLVLALACTNVANLLLARALGRRREIATRIALGAGRRHLLRQLWSESLLLSLLGGGAGLLLGVWGRRLLWAFRPPSVPATLDVAFDLRVLLFTLVLSLLTGVLFGLAPALHASRPDLATALKSGGAPPPRHGLGARTLPVVGQVAFSLLLLLGTGLFLRSLARATRIDPGFDAPHLLALSFNLEAQGYDPVRALDFCRRASEAVAALPGVRSAAAGLNRPLNQGLGGSFFLVGRSSPPPREGAAARVNGVDPGYFSTLGIPLLRGRSFTAADRADGRPVAIVNQTLARRYFAAESPLGQRLQFVGTEAAMEIVGVVADAAYSGLGEAPRPYVYFPLAQGMSGETTLYVRTHGDPAAALGSVRRAVRGLDPNLPLAGVTTLPDVLAQSLWAPRAGAALLALFGLLGLVLATSGTYGVMSYAVDQRRREIGIRLAIGERRSGILARVLSQGMGLVAAGLALGLAAAFGTARLVAAFLYGVSPYDPLTFLVAPLLLAGAAFLATLVPARRATAVDPLAVLRSE
ncbi:MAG TPA: ABC transporter permease [Thermoanaerobaculia bacterium]|nr:ABC transporter permease [Thermoanaerobaculia bacterium]